MPLRIAIKNGSLNLVKMLEDYTVNSDNKRQMNTKHAAEYQHWDILEYFIDKSGAYVEGFDGVLKWVGHTQKITPVEKKIEALDRLQGYIDSGKVKVSERGYKVGTNRDATLEEVIEKYGNIKNWVISSHPDLAKAAK
jgi:hypothetical protein